MEEIESFARKKEKWLRKYLELPYGIPTDDTFRIVIWNINTERFFKMTVQLLMQSVNGIIGVSGKEASLREKRIVSVDGKESRGLKRKSTGAGEVKALQTLNVYSSDYGMCLAQKFIDEKTNEIPAAQELLRLMDLEWNNRDCGRAKLPERDRVRNIRKWGRLCAGIEREPAFVP